MANELNPAMLQALLNNDKAYIMELLHAGMDVNARSSDDQRTALFYAQSPDVAELLIQHGADVNARDKYQGTPLHAAYIGRQEKVARTLIQHGADTEARDKFGGTPGTYAPFHGKGTTVPSGRGR